ncbi:glycoside hydrolase family 16 protein [Nocardioides montaniterrae]
MAAVRRRFVLLPAALVALAATVTLTVLPGSPSPAQATSGRTTAARTAVDGCGPVIRRSNGSAWQCSFADNFSGVAIDTSKWLVSSTAKSGFRVGNTCFMTQNVAVTGGHLDLTAASGRRFYCRSGAGGFSTTYTGGHIGTVGRFSQTYGRFEVRARYPQNGPGLHGGYWLYPAKMTYGRWPASGEIDSAEWWSKDPTHVRPTLHYRGSTTAADSGAGCVVADPTAWHSYTTVWTPTLIRFAIDGTTCFRRTWKPGYPFVAPQPFDKPFNIILNMAVDAPASWNHPTAETVLPAKYQVDYVRAWR